MKGAAHNDERILRSRRKMGYADLAILLRLDLAVRRTLSSSPAFTASASSLRVGMRLFISPVHGGRSRIVAFGRGRRGPRSRVAGRRARRFRGCCRRRLVRRGDGIGPLGVPDGDCRINRYARARPRAGRFHRPPNAPMPDLTLTLECYNARPDPDLLDPAP